MTNITSPHVSILLQRDKLDGVPLSAGGTLNTGLQMVDIDLYMGLL